MIEVYRYELQAAHSLNARSERRVFPGALLRYQGGVGCLHPWPELGDATLESQLNLLAAGGTTSKIQRALDCCVIDGAARRAGQSLFLGKSIPLSHATFTAPPTKEQIQLKAAAGFTAAKCKLRPTDLHDVQIFSAAMESSLRWRFDANESCSAEAIQDWCARLPDTFRERIDFIEDPCPYDETVWQQLSETTGVPLALDRAAAPEAEENGFTFVIWKPAVEAKPAIRSKRIIATSYMDHAIGQMFAAYEAARLGISEVCGLHTHELFAADAFFAELKSQGPQLIAPQGTGLGFDHLLAALPWNPL
jgi:o-succinylbenzoate synthase